jgi:hypothetical protein
MPQSLLRASIIGALAVVLALLGGCSAVRFAYNQAPDLAYWWLDSYVDFDDSQSPRARDAITSWFNWNRSTQLADYAALLERAQAQIALPTTPAQVCQLTDDATARFETAVDRALFVMAPSVRQFTPQQLAHMEHKYAKNNEEYAHDFLQAAPEERLAASVKRVVDRAELIYGSLSDTQRERLARGVAESPFDAELWMGERKRRQQDVLQTLRRLSAERAGVGDTYAALALLWEQTMRSPRDAYRDYQQRLRQYNCALAAQMHNLSTPEQRQRAAGRLRGWAEDLRALAAVAP